MNIVGFEIQRFDKYLVNKEGITNNFDENKK
jgi:hypothetical protein